jgi:hypothetical protein
MVPNYCWVLSKSIMSILLSTSLPPTPDMILGRKVQLNLSKRKSIISMGSAELAIEDLPTPNMTERHNKTTQALEAISCQNCQILSLELGSVQCDASEAALRQQHVHSFAR